MVGPRYPLRVLLPVLTLGGGLLAAVVVLLASLGITNRQVQELSGEYLLNVGHAFASSLQSSLRTRDLEQARTQVLRASSFHVAETAVLFDEGNRVRYTSNLSVLGVPMEATSFALSMDELDNARRRMEPVSKVSPDGGTMYILIPLRLDPRENELVSPNIGMLGLTFDLGPWRAIAQRGALVQSAIFSLLIVLLSIILAGLLRKLVTNRVGRLVETAGRLGIDSFGHSIVLEGGDEIADLSSAMDRMNKRLKSSIESLAQSEERLNRIVNHSPEAIYLTDLNGKLLLSNRVFRRWANLDDTADGHVEISSLLPPLVAEEMTTMDRSVLEGQTEVMREISLPTSADKPRLVEVIKFPVKDNAGELVGIGVIGTDVTEYRRTENELRHAQKMKAVGQLTGGLAHDFNNILQAVIGNLELIRMTQAEPSSYLSEAMEAAQRGALLTQRLLAIARNQVLEPKVLDLNKTLGSMSELLHRTLGEEIEVVFDRRPELWRCEVDPSQLENAILNLAINARDAMPGGGTLTFETLNVEIKEGSSLKHPDLPPGHYVLLAASDTGSGMTEEVRQQIFEPFFTTKEGSGGSGLGLSTIYGFVKQSGGHINVETEAGAGTAVRLYLPRSDGDLRDTTGTVSTPGMPEGGGETILVVEDNEQVRLLTSALLAELGYECVAVGSAAEALQRLDSREPVDALLTDVVLAGGMTGPELARLVRSDHPDLGIMLMSGFTAGTLPDTETLEKLGPLLQKPFLKEDLARVVRTVLDR